jgi:predicted GIY-YIG superfamily endonuclease
MSGFLGKMRFIIPDGIEHMKMKKQDTISKWTALNFLSKIELELSDSIAELYESEASYLLGDYYYVYMVECSDGSIYTGIAKDVSKRISVHNKGKGAKYTKPRLPVALKWQKMCRDRSMASKYEHKIKKLTRDKKLKLIEDYEN